MNSSTVRVSLLIACLGQAALAHAEEPAKPAQAAPSPAATGAKPAAPAPVTVPATVIEPRTPEAAAPAAPPPPDVSALSSELSSVLDELIQARSRASILAKSLFRTRIDINVLRRAD
ncbi:MAG TPA: hypothetical protein VMF89_31015, partial [Polyangiales bacterium]|nr:hypothetical protein [Polyangiales bacterium]